MQRFGIFGMVLAGMTLGAAALAAPDPELGAIARDQALKDLGTDLRLLCVAAHPDDEDGASLAYYRKKFGIKTFALIATRGEGGQNEIGSELYEELGVIRTHEMTRASRITGAELHFLDMPEFGYSKSRDETYRLWGEEETLRRMVRKIRETRPDVIITHHPPDVAHGHHQAVGHALQRAFDVANDPDAFPEQVKEGLAPWQPSRLYLRDFRGAEQEPSVVDISEIDPARGITYARIAANALEEHESQGMGFFVDRFLTSRSNVKYRLIKEAPQGRTSGIPAPGGALFDGLEDRVEPDVRALSESGLGGADISREVAAMMTNRRMSAGTRQRANRLGAVLNGYKVQVRVSDEEAIPGQKVSLGIEGQDYESLNAESITFSLEAAEWFDADLPEPVTKTAGRERIVNATLAFTIPDNAVQTIPHPEKLFEPNFLAPQLTVVARFKSDTGTFEVRKPVLLDIAPKVSIEFVDGPYLVQAGVDSELRAGLRFTNHSTDAAESSAALELPKGFKAEDKRIDTSLAAEGHEKVVPLSVSLSNLDPGDYTLRAETKDGASAEVVARVIDVTVPKNVHVGVIQSYDDTFVKTLQRLGVSHETIDVEDFTPERLDAFSTIIVDIRAYLVRPDLVANNPTLLDYVNRGGTAIVMYQKTFEWKPAYAPYRLGLSRNRVTVEDAPIEVLVPEHPLFTTPNAIGSGDWEGWRQERGLYFPSSWDDAYTPLINCADPGESPPPGSCLVAEYGDGTYMYTALGWYRQLRELHPGTIRVFANMLAL